MFYWAIDIPGLTEAECRDLATVARARGIETALAVDPHRFLTLHLDRASVEGLALALNDNTTSEIPRAVRDVLEEWLAWAGPLSKE